MTFSHTVIAKYAAVISVIDFLEQLLIPKPFNMENDIMLLTYC